MAQADSSTLSRDDYTIGWVCALPLELAASMIMLDQVHNLLPTLYGDTNSYALGSICHHNAVMACLPINQVGTNKAAIVATNMKRSFPSIRMCLVVGIGGGVPSKADVRLGDVVVGIRIMQYDKVKTKAAGEERTEVHRIIPGALGTVLSNFAAQDDYTPLNSRFSSILQEKLANETHRKFRPPNLEDRLFPADYEHISSEASCDRCDSSRLMIRGQRKTNTVVHYGGIASGNKVMKYGRKRDEIAEDLDVICFEMEAAGVMDVIDCLVIRGICDYSDSHKSKEWQNHAAVAAAAYAKGFLGMIPMTEFQSTATNLSRSSQHIPRERQKAMLASLRFNRMSFRKHTIKKNHDKTGQWLWNHPSFQEWLDPALLSRHPGFIWIRGKPGAGKSTLMKFAWLQTQMEYQQACRDRKMIVASFFFNARGETLEKSASGMYRSLLVQLLEHFHDLQRVLDSRDLEELLNLDSYPLVVLKDLLRDVVSELGNRAFFGFIDALDECHELQLMDMVRYFEELAEHATQKSIPLRICFSSRNYPYINVRRGVELRLEYQSGHAQDIANYVQSELQIENPALREQLVSQILKKSAGVFLWVVLVVDILNKEERDGRPTFTNRLSELPSGLSDLFESIIKRDNDNVDDLQLSLVWILLAQRPLELEEFYHACWHFKDPMLAKQYTKDRGEKYVLSSTKGLAQVSQSTPPIVQFIHESVRDYLLKDDGLRKLWPTLPFNWKDMGHEQLKHYCCIYIQHAINSAYINSPDVENDDISERLPLLRYVTQNVLHHAENAADSIGQGVFLEEFPTAQWASLENKYQKYNIRRLTLKADLLYILAERGFPNLIRTRLQNHPNILIRGERHKYPLFAALANGNKDAVAALLNLPSTIYDGEDITEGLNYIKDMRDYVTRTPLSWAAQEGRIGLVKLLLLAQADVNERDKAEQTPLLRAQSKRHWSVVAILIKAGADVNEKSYMYNDGDRTTPVTPLMYASAENDEISAKLLIQNGAKADAICYYIDRRLRGLTALKIASRHGHEAMARLLIEHGALGGDWQIEINPLAAAAENGHIGVVALLTENGIYPYMKECGGFALVKALHYGHFAIASLLISRGADIEFETGCFDEPLLCSPLAAASRKGHESLVRLLISKGARPDPGSLISAARINHEAIAELLIKGGASVNKVSTYQDKTPLMVACWAGHEAMVKLFIDYGADVNQAGSVTYPTDTPLKIASEAGHEAVVRLLLEHGAQAEARETLQIPLR
ncbi:ankyrin repeat protein [Metarhizium robertsii]|uniref:Pfs, NACHT and Ankyrin domain protein n=2 Tax=Metarhizium robertsii TaxID=568076 RepID=E9F858_METRA|nr:Pfs, NACHT and Ankyrin domain protein [Metarhizium robertsii ARSEF 23]EFY96150.2 Pfs, NACHT and Ankyrin domain protein [Metarhizium robertsii ARSEF 23]EXU98320.1 ankyrin repeat protein [Metarhizium robertsii]